MNGARRLVMAIVFLLAVAVCGVANAATLNVDQAFAASDPVNLQFKTVPEALLAAALSGDTILVADGNYTEPVNITKGVTLQGSGPQFTYQSNTITIKTVEAVSIKGFTITAPGDGIAVTTYDPLTLDITNNCIVGNGQHGINIGGNTTNNATFFTVNIVNNTISANKNSGIFITRAAAATKIINNIITDNTSFGINNRATSNYTVSSNNIYNNSGVLDAFCYNGIATVNYCRVTPLAGANLITDPIFLDQPGGNYALDLSSPCRNYGQNSPATLNPDGTRNDIGAYGGPGAASFWPYGYGPIVTGISATPMRVEQNGTITINATARVR